MAYYGKKRYMRKRRVIRRPRMYVRPRNYRKKNLAIARKVNLRSDVHYLSRYAPLVDTSTLTTITSGIGAALKFRLSDVTNSTEMTNLFDLYKITGVLVTFRLMDNPDSTNYVNSTTFTQGMNFYPKLWYCIDKDDGTAPTGATIRERAGARCVILRPDRFVKVFVKFPKPLLQLQSGAITDLARGMIRTDYPDVDHWGLKVFLDKMGYAGNTATVGIDKKYFFCLAQAK